MQQIVFLDLVPIPVLLDLVLAIVFLDFVLTIVFLDLVLTSNLRSFWQHRRRFDVFFVYSWYICSWGCTPITISASAPWGCTSILISASAR